MTPPLPAPSFIHTHEHTEIASPGHQVMDYLWNVTNLMMEKLSS